MKRALSLLVILCGVALAAGNVTEERVQQESAAGDHWFLKGGNFEGWHYSPLDEIHSGNVDQLGLAWSLPLDVPDGIAATPIVVDGVIYLSGAWSVVFAIDAATGAVRWQYDPGVRAALAREADPSFSWTGRISRGVAVWQGKVLVTTGDCRLIALDAASGDELWSVTTCDTKQGYSISDSPYVGGDFVFVGNAGSESGKRNRGYVSAYDIADGGLAWRFYTVPSHRPEENTSAAMRMAAATWSGDALERYGGGGSNWNEMTYDPGTGLLFFGTAGALPYLHHQRSPSGGDNLFTSSVVAVHAETGEYAWHYQTVPEDSWEYNATMNIVLADLTIDGESRDALLIAPKNGFHYVLDRKTGELIRADKFATVNWATHINLETGRPVLAPAGRFWENDGGAGEIWPNMWGAHSWNPMAWHPDEKLSYIPVVDVPTVTSDLDGEDYEDTLEMRTVVDGKPFAPGKLVAFDPVAGEARWTVGYDLPFNGGVMTTAGNLVFQGDAFGRLNAYAADSGRRLWSVRTGSNITAAPASYRVDGVQHVVVAVGGGGGLSFVYPEMHAGADVRGPTRLMAYSLDGDADMPPTTFPQRPVPAQPALDATADQLEYGAMLFNGYCSGCHGNNASTRRGSSVPDLRYSVAAIFERWPEIVQQGERRALGMPAFDLGDEELALIRDYVLSRADQLRESR